MSETHLHTHRASFPVFLPFNQLHLLIIGHSPVSDDWLIGWVNGQNAGTIKLLDTQPSERIETFAHSFPNIQIIYEKFHPDHLEGVQMVFSFSPDPDTNRWIRAETQARHLLTYFEKFRAMSDFDLAIPIHQGKVRIGISDDEYTSRIAGEIKVMLENKFPGELTEVLEKLHFLKEDPSSERKAIVSSTDQKKSVNRLKIRIRRVMIYSFIVMVSMIIGHLILSQIPTFNIQDTWDHFSASLDENFHYYFLAGVLAQLIDGALGMAYGVSVTTFLLSLGLPAITPAIASASMHASEIFTTGASSLVYMRYKNINKKLFKSLLIPGILGAIAGSATVSYFSKENVSLIRPFVALYTLSLGILIILKAARHQKQKKKKKFTNFRPIAAIGGFLDSLGGGGWGPIVTGSLIAGGRSLRYAIGSSHLTKFFVAIISSITFLLLIGIEHWQIIFGLVLGGMVTAPLSIYLSTKIPTRKGLLAVGFFIIILSLRTIITTFL